jgi:hypothetical protein
LPLRKLRYVLDHRLLPGLRVKVAENAVGRPRYFTEFEAFGIACAATLLVAGLKREAVVGFMDGLAELTWDGPPSARERPSSSEDKRSFDRIALYVAFTERKPSLALLADGTNVRIQVGSRDTGWRQPRTLAKLSEDYQPRATVHLDLAQLRDQLRD